MSADLPPIPPRPDLPLHGPPTTWRHVQPGRMGAGAIFAAGFRIWAANWLPWAVVTLLMSGVVTVLIAWIDPWFGTYGFANVISGEALYRPEPSPLVIPFELVSAFFLGPWALVILTRAAFRTSIDEPLRGSAVVGRTLRGVHSTDWIFLLLGVAAGLIALPWLIIGFNASSQEVKGLMGLVLLAFLVWLGPRLYTVIEVFVAEDARGISAIRGSWNLSKRAWGTAAAVLVLIVLASLAIALVPGSIVGGVFPRPVVEDAVPRAIVQSLVGAIVGPLATAITAALYLELRARKGLLDQTVIRAKLARFDSV